MRVVWSVLGYMITIVSAFFICAFVIDFMAESDHETSVLVGLLVFFGLTGASGLVLIKKGWRGNREKQERMVLELAASKNGRITPVEIAMETSLTATESQIILDALCHQGIAETQVTENGAIVYAFTGLISASDRETAQNPLER
jgi:hypothetical protein